MRKKPNKLILSLANCLLSSISLVMLDLMTFLLGFGVSYDRQIFKTASYLLLKIKNIIMILMYGT